MAGAVDWIAADWGTSNLRVWALDSFGAIVAERGSPKGMGQLTPEEFEPALLELVDDLLPSGRVTDVVVCGMAGARQGWIEAPYRSVPCTPAGEGAVTAPTHDARLNVRILPGLSQSAPPDVLRGEETQLAGFLAEDPGFDGVVCMPGTHTKWVRLARGEVRSFHTVMTGESFAFYATQSVLRHSLDAGWDDDAFLAGVGQTFARPETLATDLFALRAAGLLAPQAPGVARARLSGLLIGLELAGTREVWHDRPVVVIGTATLARHYVAALTEIGARATRASGEDLVLAGLRAARAALAEGAS